MLIAHKPAACVQAKALGIALCKPHHQFCIFHSCPAHNVCASMQTPCERRSTGEATSAIQAKHGLNLYEHCVSKPEGLKPALPSEPAPTSRQQHWA